MKTRLKVYGFVALALLAAGIKKYGHAEVSALNWHLSNGFHAEIGGIRVRVPLSYEAIQPAGLPFLLINRQQCLLWHESGAISIMLTRYPFPEAKVEPRADTPTPNAFWKPLTKVGEKAVMFAGKPGRCIEYTTGTNYPLVTGYDVECRFSGNISLRLLGSPGLKDDFYDMIQTAESVKKGS